MFKSLLTRHYISILEKNAMSYIKEDRFQFNDIYNHILEYISKQELLISNVKLLINKQDYWENVQVYTNNSDKVAKELFSQLCNKFDDKFMLKIIEWEDNYLITYDFRQVCTITSLKLYKKYAIDDFIDPVQITVNKNIILVIPPMLEIIKLYTELYNPSMASKWSSTLVLIKELESLIDVHINRILNSKYNKDTLLLSPSFEHHLNTSNKANKAEVQIIKHQSKTKHKTHLQSKQIIGLLMDYVADTNYLLLSHKSYLLDMNSDNKKKYIDKLTSIDIISRNDIECDFKSISNYLNNHMSNGLIYKEKYIFLPNERNIKKHALYIVYNVGDTPHKYHIMNIWNSLSYELINYIPTTINSHEYKFVDPITEIKFIYISLWNNIILKKISKLEDKDNDKLIKEKQEQLQYYRERINIFEPKKNYIGIYVNLFVQRKKLSLLNQNVNKSIFYCNND